MKAMSFKTSARRISRSRRSVLVAAAIAITVVCGASNAEATMVASPYYQFNPVLMDRGAIGPDCNVVSGTVMDPLGNASGFNIYSGIQVACHTNRTHNIYAAVQQWYAYSSNGPWYGLGGTSWWNQTNGYGMGSSILVTGPWMSCAPVYWEATTTVTIDGATRHPVIGPYKTAAKRGC